MNLDRAAFGRLFFVVAAAAAIGGCSSCRIRPAVELRPNGEPYEVVVFRYPDPLDRVVIGAHATCAFP